WTPPWFEGFRPVGNRLSRAPHPTGKSRARLRRLKPAPPRGTRPLSPLRSARERSRSNGPDSSRVSARNSYRDRDDLRGEHVILDPASHIPPSSSFFLVSDLAPTNGARDNEISSVQAVKPEGAAGHHTVLRRRRQAGELLSNHVGRAREEAVGVRIVRRPQDLIGTNVVGQHPEAALDRFE